MKHYPIQLQNVWVEELSMIVHDRFKFPNDGYDKSFKYTVYSTSFDEESSLIAVKVELSIEPESLEPEKLDKPFSLKVSVAGEFKVDTEKFPMQHLEDWSVKNAPIILLPYIREHAFSLSVRSGFNPVVLPLVEVPTIKIVNQD